MMLTRLARNPAGLFGLIVSAALLLIASLSLIWTPADPLQVHPASSWAPPSAEYPLGADSLGRDIASQMMVGSQITLLAAIGATAVAVLVGLTLAALIAFAPRWLATLIERVVDIWVAFPTLIIALILVTAFRGSTLAAVVAIGLGSATAVTRTILPELRRAMSSDHVLLAVAAGARADWLLARHILPAVTPTLIVRTTQIMGVAALAEAGLSYLGLGTPPPTPSWGRMLASYQQQIYTRPEVLAVPAIAIVLAILGFNLLGDGLRDVLDVRRRRD